MPRFVLLLLALSTCSLHAQQNLVDPKIDFNRDVRPILSENCFTCHGPDKQKSGLRLDQKAFAFKPTKSGKTTFVLGKPEDSELIKRVISVDAEERMPPKKQLKPEEIEVLRRWISQGVEYKGHWAFIKPERAPEPEVKNSSWPKNSIDRFVLARLEKEGLKPTPEAPKHALIRRAALDLTGLPPTPQEVDQFLKDSSPDAYEKMLDRLFASPRYGERMAMNWLDGARYADSHGYQADFERFMWPWRDWVINAFNQNMPFDQFTIEQLAGDLLPNATTSQKVATGFNRNHRINTEGGAIQEEWRFETLVDRVETTGAVWLGLTTGCGRCHDHKYDPLTQKEFYQLCAYFNNVSETGTAQEKAGNHVPNIKVPNEEQTQKIKVFDEQIAAADKRFKELEPQFAAKIPELEKKLMEGPGEDVTAGMQYRIPLEKDGAESGGKLPAGKAAKIKFKDGMIGNAAEFTGNEEIVYGTAKEGRQFERTDKFTISAWVQRKGGGLQMIVSRMNEQKDYRGMDLYLQDGHLGMHLVNKWPENALKVESTDLTANENSWHHVCFTYDGSSKAEGVHLYVDGVEATKKVEQDGLKDTAESDQPLRIGARMGTGRFTGLIDDVRVYDRVLSPDEANKLAFAPLRDIAKIPQEKRNNNQKDDLLRYLRSHHGGELSEAERTLAKLKRERDQFEASLPTVMVMDEAKPRPMHIHFRGEYDKPRDEVKPGTPAFLPPLPEGQPNNRLGFARWIASADNPLTARVFANRIWEQFFGVGLVKTSENLGSQAEWPSHPELFDWLATEFVRLKWDIKAFQKLIMLSATYRQDTKVTPEIHARDPENRLLSHGPRFRIQAELLRDQALYVSGLLVEKLGGPSVRPYQPDGVWDETNVYGNLRNYKHDKGENLYRRTFYTIWKRTAAPPNVTIFDMPSREVCTVRRSRTNTPLQALTMMNDVTYVEAARALAARAIKEGGASPADRLAFMFQLATCRKPSVIESTILLKGFNRRLEKYKSDVASAKKLLELGDTPFDPKTDHAELAAYTTSASNILNLDETITKE